MLTRRVNEPYDPSNDEFSIEQVISSDPHTAPQNINLASLPVSKGCSNPDIPDSLVSDAHAREKPANMDLLKVPGSPVEELKNPSFFKSTRIDSNVEVK